MNVCLRSKRCSIPLSQVSVGWRERPAAFSSPVAHMRMSPELCHLASVHLALSCGKSFLTWYSLVNNPVISWQKGVRFRICTCLVNSVLSHSASSLLSRMRKCSLASPCVRIQPTSSPRERDTGDTRKRGLSCSFSILPSVGIGSRNSTEMGICGFWLSCLSFTYVSGNIFPQTTVYRLSPVDNSPCTAPWAGSPVLYLFNTMVLCDKI